MLLYYMFALTCAIEGGYSIPSVGFTDTHAGVVCALVVSHDLRILDTGVRGNIGYYPGKNRAYSLSTYGVRVYATKHTWRVAPILDLGVDYVYRTIDNDQEKGPAFTYGLGLVINIPLERMRVYPAFFYEGITDFARHGGFLGMKLGIAYAF
jgi:hypothetical protein